MSARLKADNMLITKALTPDRPKRLPLKKCRDDVLSVVDKPASGSIAEELDAFRIKLISSDELTEPDLMKDRILAKPDEFDSLLKYFLKGKIWRRFMTSNLIEQAYASYDRQIK